MMGCSWTGVVRGDRSWCSESQARNIGVEMTANSVPEVFPEIYG